MNLRKTKKKKINQKTLGRTVASGGFFANKKQRGSERENPAGTGRIYKVTPVPESPSQEETARMGETAYEKSMNRAVNPTKENEMVYERKKHNEERGLQGTCR